MHIGLTRSVLIEGEHQQEGKVIEVAKEVGDYLIAIGKAKPAEPPKQPRAQKAPKPLEAE